MDEYISRKATIEKIRDQGIYGSGYSDEEREDDVVDMIESVPAADVRPVVKAHWTDHRTNEHDGEWYCSACGKAITIYMGPDRDDHYSYCPNCGADMREAHDGI